MNVIDRWDLVGAAGIGCVVGGVGWAYWPCGLILLGLLLCCICYAGDR